MKDSYYFSHDSNARNDPKILAMRTVYGFMGYGMYWAFIEMMREQENHKLSMQGQYVWNAFALQMQCDPDAVQKYVQCCINDFGLFDSDGEFFWSNSLLKRMEKVQVKSEKARESAYKRWGCERNANAQQTQSDGNAIKEKKKKRNTNTPNDLDPLFAKFWDAYPKKKSKDDAVKAWGKLKLDEALFTKIVTALNMQKQSHEWTKDNGQFIPYPASWLNGRRWEDEVSIGVQVSNEDDLPWQT